MKIALAMIVNGVAKEAEVLSRCLTVAAPHVDGLYLTLTHKAGEKVDEQVENVAKAFGANISYFEWVNDFSAARNFNFSQVPKEFDYIFWLDSDDVPRKLEDLKTTIEARPADAYSMFYLYAFDEYNNPTVVHHKTRVVKNDGCVQWAGRLHEDFKENRSLVRLHINKIDILHLSNDERFADAKDRNYEIAKAQVSENPNDARSYWNWGNSAFAVGKLDEALGAFDTFLSKSNSDDEKYIVHLRKAETFWVKRDVNKSLDEARYAVGTQPSYPDAYHFLGRVYYEQGDYWKAIDMFKDGLLRKPPYYQIVVFNPREYDVVPLLNLAKCYYALRFPQLALPLMEKASKIIPKDTNLKKAIRTIKREAKDADEFVKELGKLRKVKDLKKLKAKMLAFPKKFHNHPEFLRLWNTNFIKTETSGRDLVIFCGFTEEEWTPASIAKKGSGGSEEAVLEMSKRYHKLGWNVTVYNNCGTETQEFDGITYKPYMSWNYRDKQDVVILWRQTKPLDWEINSSKVIVDMHDVIPAGEFTPERIQRVWKVFFKSKWHRELFPNIPDDKCQVIPNGINPEIYSGECEKDKYLMINTASPVRSLSALVDIMREVRKVVPEAKMQWAYGWTTTDNGLLGREPNYPLWKEKVLKEMAEVGIESLGRLTFDEIAKLYLKANLYVYPTGFPEIDCISLTKALAAGAFPVTTDYGAMKEKAGHGGEFITYAESFEKPGMFDFAVEGEEVKQWFVEKIIQYLQNPPSEQERQAMRKYAQDNYSWDSVAQRWHEQLQK